MKRKVLRLSFVVFLCLSLNLHSQTKWTLDACISYAMEHNLQVKRQELSTKIAKNELLQSKIELLPDLNSRWDHILKRGKRDDQNYQILERPKLQQRGEIGLSSELNIYSGFLSINTIRKNKYSLLEGLENLEKIKNDISLNIATAYLQILLDKELLDVASSQLGITELQVNKTTRLVEVGNVAKGQLLEIKSQQAAEKVNLTNANNNLSMAYLTLVQILDLDSTAGFDIVIPVGLEVIDNDSLRSINDIYPIAGSTLPQIKGAEYNLKGAKTDLAIAYGGLSPRLSFSYTYGSYYTVLDTISYPYRNQLSDNLTQSCVFTLSIPIFNKLQAQKRVCNAKIGVKDSQYQLDQAKQTLYKEIQQAHADAVAAFENYNSRQEAVKAMDESFNYTQQKFDVGLVNSVDYNIAKNNLIKAKSDLLQAKYEYIFKTKVLDFYQGKPIKL